MPFGGGVHKCIGMHFGRAEVKALVHRILLSYRIELPDDGYEVRWDMTVAADPRRRAPRPRSDLCAPTTEGTS